MNLKIHTYTNIGGKQTNEDCLDYYCDDLKGIFILADGLGGHGNGEVASKLVTQALLSELKEAPFIDIECMKMAFQKANDTLRENQETQNLKNMKTTAVALCICDDCAFWGHLGDSRLYYLSENEISEITRDHSVTYMKYLSGDISYKEINTDEDRSSLLGAFGNKERYHPEFTDIPKNIKKGDAFLLCSDGFWEYVYDEEILIDFLKATTPKEWAEMMLLRHIKRIKPSNDNYSLIAVFVD